ncbi:copper homeostasis protein CutC [Shivajiella indica]|uniref:PF03932 family protein CutC n=1 Tax=Shivajiella indica TaxID=872115 RepID=A0ABW5B9X2_9BACT
MEQMVIEAPVFTVEAAIKAAEFGIHRLELCSDFGEGGETPSAGNLSFLKEKISIPIYVMIRPRGGDFVYTLEELEVMRRDIGILKSLGADGFVFGVLDKKGDVDKAACESLVNQAGGLPCTFHRAFDICKSKDQALEDIIDCGFKRILTSGGENSVDLGLNNILNYLELAGERIIIIPGGGLKSGHIPQLKSTGKLREIHASCKTFRPTESMYFHPNVSLSNDPNAFKQVLTIDERMVIEFLRAMN